MQRSKVVLTVCLALALGGCAARQYHPQPISPAEHAARLRARTLEDPQLRAFIERNLGHEVSPWPEKSWNLDLLTLAAFYLSPDLEAARARVAASEASVVTAGARPNPGIRVAPGAETSPESPWLFGLSFDLPIETAGKRGDRIERARSLTEEIHPYLEDIASRLYANCPSGVGSHGHLHLSNTELDRVLHEGSRWMLDQGSALREDLERTEESGRIPGADAAFVSDRARERGRNQLGTLGAGNHFIEVDRVAEVYDQAMAARLGIYRGNVAVQIHCGSRGLGHQICEDYVSRFQKTARDYGIELPDRELVCAPFDSKEGQEYFHAMACAANFAFANRQLLAHMIRRSFDEVLAGKIKGF